MSILRSLYSAVAGLNSHGNAMDVVSDNIANVNTVGFKAGRGHFQDVLGTVGNAAIAIGQGSRLAGVEQMHTQGALLGTGVVTNLAIEGDGFFVVEGAFSGIDGTYYTRAGQFHMDANGALVNTQDLNVQGYLADAQGRIGSQLGDIVIPPTITTPPQVTGQVDIAANLDASAPVLAAFDPLDPNGTSNFSTSVTVYDSLGAAHVVDVYFRTSGGGAWEWHAMVDGGELTAGVPGVATEIANGNMTFTPAGALDTEAIGASSADFLGATPGQVINFDFGDAITTDGGTGLTRSTGYASESTVALLEQDGYASGTLATIGISEDGTVTGVFTNGERRPLAQIAMARFRNNHGLNRAGGSLFTTTDDSGLALVGQAGTGGRGAIAAGALEQSNVDLAQEFVNLIAFQRGFQSNSRAVTTADEMLVELVNLKR